jgi:hypothetical protein
VAQHPFAPFRPVCFWSFRRIATHIDPPPSLLQVVEDGYEFFANRSMVTVFSAPNYCGEFDNAGAIMSIDESLVCSFQVRHDSMRCAMTACVAP